MRIVDMGGFLAADLLPWEEPTRAIAAPVAAAAGGEGRTQWGQAFLSSGECTVRAPFRRLNGSFSFKEKMTAPIWGSHA